MHSFQNFIVRLIPNHPPPLETRIWKLVVRALDTFHTDRQTIIINFIKTQYAGINISLDL